MGSISQLDAINNMLLMAGESLVSDLDNNSGLDSETAEFVLDQFVRDFQMRGLANNQYLKKYTLDEKGKINLPSSTYVTLSAELISNHTNDDGYHIIGVAKGSGSDKYLWNVTDQKDEWDKGVEYTIEITQAINWEDMDTPVQRAILSAAARQYQMLTQGDGDTDIYLEGLEALYTSKGLGSDFDDKRRTVFQAGSYRLREALDRRSAYNDATVLRYWRTK
jgi:hypothetical protein